MRLTMFSNDKQYSSFEMSEPTSYMADNNAAKLTAKNWSICRKEPSVLFQKF